MSPVPNSELIYLLSGHSKPCYVQLYIDELKYCLSRCKWGVDIGLPFIVVNESLSQTETVVFSQHNLFKLVLLPNHTKACSVVPYKKNLF